MQVSVFQTWSGPVLAARDASWNFAEPGDSMSDLVSETVFPYTLCPHGANSKRCLLCLRLCAHLSPLLFTMAANAMSLQRSCSVASTSGRTLLPNGPRSRRTPRRTVGPMTALKRVSQSACKQSMPLKLERRVTCDGVPPCEPLLLVHECAKEVLVVTPISLRAGKRPGPFLGPDRAGYHYQSASLS